MTIVYFIAVLSLIVLVHEIGHFTAAKAFKVYCKEFALGFGPTVLKIQGKETKYSLRILPFGGYVSMAGEEGVDSQDLPFERTLKGINRFKRAIIMLAGIAMNILLTWAIFVGIFLHDPRAVVSPPAVIETVLAGYPADKAGLLAQDEVIAIILADGKKTEIADYFGLANVLSSCQDELTLVVLRQGEELKIKVTPLYNSDAGRYLIGINGPEPTYRNLTFTECFSAGSQEVIIYTKEMFNVIGNLFKGQGFENLAGPLGIAQMTGEQAKAGLLNLSFLVAILSLNVALFNLLPLPILDGGRVLLILLEALINRPLSKKFETALMMISLFFITLLMVIAFYNDIVRLF